MTIRTFRSAAIGVALLVAGCAAAAQTHRETGREFERTVAASPGGELTLNLDSGGGVIVHGSSENRVTVRARLGGPDWRDTEVTIERVPGGVRASSTSHPLGAAGVKTLIAGRKLRAFDRDEFQPALARHQP